MINFKWSLELETEKGEVKLEATYSSDNRQLTVVVEPIDPDTVSEAVYELLNWCEGFLHEKITKIEGLGDD